MDRKNRGEDVPAIDPVTKEVLWAKHRVPIYKFLKTCGRNCGMLEENEQRDHTSYDYSDEM